MGQFDTSSLAGKLLLAMPNLGDPRFYKAAILICAHDESGAMGLVINHVLPDLKLGTVIQSLEIESNIKVPESLLKLPVICGGPVEIARGFLLHSADFEQESTIKVSPEIHVTGTLDAIEEMAQKQRPQNLLFTLGYAGWGKDQLEIEIMENAWMVSPATKELVFHTAPEKVWDKAMAAIGVNPHLMSDQIGHA
ncbi:MAG: YqgE/AlgH family protein [Alphaproteobacteria bacterium]|nr:YqgE/AlgH family protein [Alphaproteobacteria bacterium]NCQ88963.1 YqgE/AlgH family protein [Alphaproteobacteria bacterium]NCT07864.1 YqgE/AlgH family protein [Alphaproteobacteria bacterium]